MVNVARMSDYENAKIISLARIHLLLNCVQSCLMFHTHTHTKIKKNISVDIIMRETFRFTFYGSESVDIENSTQHKRRTVTEFICRLCPLT